jgi:hypothetical protein
MSPIRFLPAGLSLLLLAACASTDYGSQVLTASPDGPQFTGPAPTLRTDRAVYTAVGDTSHLVGRTWHFTVIATLTNPSDLTLYIGTCPRYGFGTYGTGSAYEGPWACSGGMPGIAVAPHSVRVDTLHIAGPNSFDGRTGEGFGATSGMLALTYGLATCPDVEGCHAGTLAAVSAPFTVNATP